MAERIARQTLAKRGPGLLQRGAPPARRRPRGHAPVRHHLPSPGGRHRRRGRPVQRRLLPPLRLEGHPGGRHARGRHRTAAQLPGPPDGQAGRGPSARCAAGSRASCRRRRTTTSPRRPWPCCGTRAASARASPRLPRRPAPRWPVWCASRSSSWAAPAAELDASLAAHAVVGTLSDHLWQRTRPTGAETDQIVAFCLAVASRTRAGRTESDPETETEESHRP